ncbi:UbiA prenyltransferase family [Daedaleopsis nitida]|nr:UbiA prenyltransferase family [Daedaleopsis nitida]
MNAQLLTKTSFFLSTLYTFTKSDMMTIVVPTTAFGTVASGSLDPAQLLYRLFWVWLHLLQFCISNQTLNLAEDANNKPWRPIPAGRISVRAARWLRWMLVGVCIVYSATCNVLPMGLILLAATIAYNELHLSSHWFSRNALNAIGYASFSIGAANAGCTVTSCVAAAASLIAQVLISLVIFTTIHALDFKDIEGDGLIGRRTLPILYPLVSRLCTAALIPFWSLLLAYHYRDASPLISLGTVVLGLSTGARFAWKRSREADKMSGALYNIWLCFLHVMPFVGSSMVFGL